MTDDSPVRTLQRLDTELHADTTEWCPLNGQEDKLLCGTYQLVERSDEASKENGSQESSGQVRKGQLRLYQLVNNDGKLQLDHHHTVSMPGVLDIKWSGNTSSTKPVFGLVNAEGRLELWTLPQDNEDSVSAPSQIAQQSLTPNSIALALDWSQATDGHVQETVVASDTSGALSVFDVRQELQLQQQWTAHCLEAWICAFSSAQPGLVYSGGDDCRFKGWDLRAGTESPIFTKKRDMGVCSIQSNKHHPHLLAVGGYDETVEIYDTRQMQHAVGRGGVGGGVWRVKWDPDSGTRLLTASMYNGCHILDCSKPDLDPLPVLHHYAEHELGYGADWCHISPASVAGTRVCGTGPDADSNTSHQSLIATCSFYDHSLHLWQCCW